MDTHHCEVAIHLWSCYLAFHQHRRPTQHPLASPTPPGCGKVLRTSADRSDSPVVRCRRCCWLLYSPRWTTHSAGQVKACPITRKSSHPFHANLACFQQSLLQFLQNLQVSDSLSLVVVANAQRKYLVALEKNAATLYQQKYRSTCPGLLRFPV